jgi:hypothetical protein
MHTSYRSPDSGLTRFGPVDNLNAADTFAFQAACDCDTTLPTTDDDDIVVGVRASANPIRRVALGPTLSTLRLRIELFGCVRTIAISARIRWLRQANRRAQATDCENAGAAKEVATIELGACLVGIGCCRRFRGFGRLSAIVGHVVQSFATQCVTRELPQKVGIPRAGVA